MYNIFSMKKLDMTVLAPAEVSGYNVDEFQQALVQTNNPISAEYCLAVGDGSKEVPIFVRILLEESHRLRQGQKFVITFRFQAFGEVLMIDVVSLNEDFHWQIASRYLSLYGIRRRGSHSLTDEVPYVIAGGFANCRNDQIDFSGESQDFGDKILGLDVNCLAQFLLINTEIATNIGSASKGEELLCQLAQVMLTHGGQSDFYERFVDFARDRNAKFYAQNIGALIRMRADDVAARTGLSYGSALVLEMSGGKLSSYIMLSGVAERIRKKKEIAG